jgi:Flp pilus assembly pilin Flp
MAVNRPEIRFWQRLRPLTRRLGCERGQDAVEYVLLAVLIGLCATAGMVMLAQTLDASYTGAANCVANPSFASHGKGGGTGAPGNGKGKGNGPPTGTCPGP